MNGRSIPSLQIVVLAAGFSSRMGRPKPLARLRGQGLLARTLELARELEASSIIVVIPRNAARYRLAGRGMKLSWAVNSRRAEGLSSSVRRGIVAARGASAILFLPADLARLKRSEVARLIRRWRSFPRRLVARNLAGVGVIPLILPKWLFAKAREVTGDVGLRELIATLRSDQRVLVELPSAALDVDTPPALAEARRRLRPPA
jgi:molybdenum cofactor cytidylyltransferase